MAYVNSGRQPVAPGLAGDDLGTERAELPTYLDRSCADRDLRTEIQTCGKSRPHSFSLPIHRVNFLSDIHENLVAVLRLQGTEGSAVFAAARYNSRQNSPNAETKYIH